MSKTFPDGIVEIGIGSNLPPGNNGQHVSMNYCWWRVDGGEWEPSVERSMRATMEALEIADTVAEFKELMSEVA